MEKIRAKKREQKSDTRIPANTSPSESVQSGSGYPLTGLQRTIGNQAVLRLMESGGNGPQSTVAPPGESALERQSPGECPASPPAGLSGFLTADKGQPLPTNLRASAEQTFQHSFADVRLHVGSQANQMARQVKARAFTSGRDIVFRAGEYIPETETGRKLLWHELGHVANPNESTRGVLRALRYDTTDWRIPTPAKGHTVKSMHDAVDAKTAKKPPDITSANVKGVTPGSEAEIFLWHILFQLGRPDRWDTFVRLQTAIGWPPPPKADAGGGTVAPQGLVTVTIDDKGNATAELEHAGFLTQATTGKTGADAVKQLQADVQVQSVAKGDKDWGEKGFEGDLTDVLDSFQLLPPSNKAALKGVNLLRFSTLPKGDSGEFSRGGGVAKGATSITAQPTLKLADSAFTHSERVQGDFQHQTPSSFQTILHEVGHAVEVQAVRPAAEALDLAVMEENRTFKAKDKAGNTAAVAAVAQRKTALQATEVSAQTIKGLATTAGAKETAAETALKSASAAAKNFTLLEISDSSDYRAAVETAEATLQDYSKKSDGADLDALDDSLVAAISARDELKQKVAARDLLKLKAADNPALATFAPVETAQNEWEDALRTLAHTRRRSLRLDNFVTVVNSNNITPFTKYARDNWPYKPQEFYAEAYSLWLTDPKFLQNNYKPIFDFFDSGAYEK